VHIRTRPTVTIRDYTANQTLLVERPSSNIVDLAIDKGKYFNTILDDVMDVQADMNMMSMWSDDASEQMKIVIDTDVLTALLGKAVAANRGTTAGAKSASINLGVTGTPVQLVARNPDRWSGRSHRHDRASRAGARRAEHPGDRALDRHPGVGGEPHQDVRVAGRLAHGRCQSVLRNGRLGQVDRFTIYSSNLLPSGVAAGWRRASGRSTRATRTRSPSPLR
jgi:hypothetical protein